MHRLLSANLKAAAMDTGPITASELKPAPTYWELERHIRSALSEGFVAEWLHSQHNDATWEGVNNRLFDVSSAIGNVRIDAKAGFFGTYLDADGDTIDGLGFMGSRRSTQAREGVTHYGITVLTSDARLSTAIPGKFELLGTIAGKLYVFPAAELNRIAVPSFTKSGNVGRGLNRWIPLDLANDFLELG